MISAADIRTLVSDISRQNTAASIILGQDRQAVPALSRFLDGTAESIPHARRFAVQMLAAIAGGEATVALRRALHRHDLDALPPVLAHSEWLVKNAAFAALAEREGRAIVKEMDYGLHVARLSAAAKAAGRFKLVERIPCLVHLLSDDVLSRPAQDGLSAFGATAVPALLETLAVNEDDIASLKRARAALDLLGGCGSQGELRPVGALLMHSRPALAAAAGLALIRAGTAPAAADLATALVRGCLLTEAVLAGRCLEALQRLPPRPLVEAARTVLTERTVQDMYGDPCIVSNAAHARVAARILRRPDVDAAPMVAELPGEVLVTALRGLAAAPSAATATALRRHRYAGVREAFERLSRTGMR